MTCIVGLVHEDSVWIAGDSAGSDGWSVAIRSDTKVFRVGPYVDRFMATTFMDAVRETLRTGGWIRTKEGREDGGTFLVGVAGRLYAVHDDFQIGHTFNGYAAVGSGYLTALGSLHTTQSLAPDDPETRLTVALEAASTHVSGVAAPFTVLSTEVTRP